VTPLDFGMTIGLSWGLLPSDGLEQEVTLLVGTALASR